MCSVVDKIKALVVYLDHKDTFVCVNWDDIVANLVCELPKVINDVKVVTIEKQQGEKLPNFYTSLGEHQNRMSKHQH